MRVLLVRAGALGDLILLRSVVASLRAAGASVTLLAPERPGSALVGPGAEEAQRLISWDGPVVPRLMAGQPPAELGEYEIALCYSRSVELARGLESVSRTVIVHDPRQKPYDRPDPLDVLGIPRVEPSPIRPTAEERGQAGAWLDRLPRRFVAVHPGSGSARKNWPFERFVATARALSADRPWLLSLGPAEADACADGALVARDLPPRLLGAVLAEAGLYLGNDSGVSHLAAAWGAPTVALFGPTDPAVWSPRGPRVRTLRAADETMASIPVEDVVTCGRRLMTDG